MRRDDVAALCAHCGERLRLRLQVIAPLEIRAARVPRRVLFDVSIARGRPGSARRRGRDRFIVGGRPQHDDRAGLAPSALFGNSARDSTCVLCALSPQLEADITHVIIAPCVEVAVALEVALALCAALQLHLLTQPPRRLSTLCDTCRALLLLAHRSAHDRLEQRADLPLRLVLLQRRSRRHLAQSWR